MVDSRGLVHLFSKTTGASSDKTKRHRVARKLSIYLKRVVLSLFEQNRFRQSSFHIDIVFHLELQQASTAMPKGTTTRFTRRDGVRGKELFTFEEVAVIEPVDSHTYNAAIHVEFSHGPCKSTPGVHHEQHRHNASCTSMC